MLVARYFLGFWLVFTLSAKGLSDIREASNDVPEILVVLSGEDKIILDETRQGGLERIHETGFFLSELMIPLKALVDAGYKPTFATPHGTKPVMDQVSDDAFWFGRDELQYRSYRNLCENLGLCGEGRVGPLDTQSFSQLLEQGLDSFSGVFFPGGHAPMEDLYKDKKLGEILRHFHENNKPTALICHAPIALLSVLDNASEFGRVLNELNLLRDVQLPEESQKLEKKLAKLSRDWIYRGYEMTSFSTKEEQQEEPSRDNVLGGFVKFYPDEALDYAGAQVTVRARKWQNNVVQDRELITGQNPFSDKNFAKVLISALEKSLAKKGK